MVSSPLRLRVFDAFALTARSWTILAHAACSQFSELQLCLSSEDYMIPFHNKINIPY